MLRASVEAEYQALASTTSEFLWVVQLLKELHVSVHFPSVLFCDNNVVIHIANNPTFNECTKHIELDCHFVCDHVAWGIMKLLPVRSHLYVYVLITVGDYVRVSNIIISIQIKW